MCKKLMIAVLVLFLGASFADAQQVKVLPEVIELQGQGELRSVFVGIVQDGSVVADLSTVANFNSSNLKVFTVDQTGKIVYSHQGYTPGAEDELEERLQELAEVK